MIVVPFYAGRATVRCRAQPPHNRNTRIRRERLGKFNPGRALPFKNRISNRNMRRSGTSSKCKDHKTEKQDHKAMKADSKTGATQAAGREEIRNAVGTDDVSTRAIELAQPRWLIFPLAEAADD